jgi:hypothetical protein
VFEGPLTSVMIRMEDGVASNATCSSFFMGVAKRVGLT